MTMYPKSLQAERIVRTTWLHTLEAEAIEMCTEKNPSKGSAEVLSFSIFS